MGGPVVKNPPANAGDMALIPGLENPLEKERAPRSGILAWEIPGTEEPGRPQSMALQKVRHLVTKQQHEPERTMCGARVLPARTLGLLNQ